MLCNLSKFLFSLSLFCLLSSGLSAQGGYTLPSNFYEAGCIYPSQQFDMSIAQKYESQETDVSTYYSAVVGDLDGDGFSEIVIPAGEHNLSQYILIFNHRAELIKRINLPQGATMHTNEDSVVLADLDNDGKSEIIVTASNGRRLLIFDYQGNLLADEKYPTAFPKTFGVADFNQDGIPELYIGTRIYSFLDKKLLLIADGGYGQATVAQDVLQKDGRYIPELVSVEGVYKVTINSLRNASANSVIKVVSCDVISRSAALRERTFALADIDLDGTIEVVTVVPISSEPRKIEVKVWNSQTGKVKYEYTVNFDKVSSIRNSWPFIGDTDGDGYPDIIFMGGLAIQGETSIYRLEYDLAQNKIVERVRNNTYNDYSSMSTSMSMFDFNNDGKQEIVYRDEDALYIINGETLQSTQKMPECYSGTGWEYPVVVSLTPSGESSIIMSSSHHKAWPANATGTLRIYGADVAKGNKPWMPARKVWNQYSFYQNIIQDDLKVISKPAPLNVRLTADDNSKTIQPFNGHMTQLGIIRPSTLESVYPLADAAIDKSATTFGYNRLDDVLGIDFEINNLGDAPMDPDILIEVFKVVDGDSVSLYEHRLTEAFYPGDKEKISITIPDFSKHYPFQHLRISIASGKYDCDENNNTFTIVPDEVSGILYVKKDNGGNGLTWAKAFSELSEALQKSKTQNALYPYSITQVWIAEGTYKGVFEMQDGVNIYGGFKGGETDVEQSLSLKYPTILDAEGKGRVLAQIVDYKVATEWRGLTLQNGKSAEHGGGAYLKKNGTLSYSTIKNNASALNGGGIYAENAEIINCIIEQNTAQNMGGGVYAADGSKLINNTIVKNKAREGAGVYAVASVVSNNIIYENAEDNLVANGGTVANNIAQNENSIDPMFVNFDGGDYRLLPISPAINSGDNAIIISRKLDIAGNPRIYEQAIADLGAFEYQGIKLTLSAEGYFYVNQLKNGNGANWANATQQLSSALDAARAINTSRPNTVKRIWVATGTYTGNYEMVEGTAVHGGFVGNETDFDQIDPIANKTYLDAKHSGRVLTQATDFAAATEWAGFVIQNGNEVAEESDVYGGGVYLKKNGILKNAVIRNNKAVAYGYKMPVNAYGGGIYLEEGASLKHSIIESNEARVEGEAEHGVAQGGGIYNLKNRLSYLIVRNNKTISGGNTDGAACYTTGDIVNNIVNGNTGLSAIYLAENASAINNTVVDNKSASVVSGTNGTMAKNNIVYNANAEQTYFTGVRHEEYSNFVGVDPLFADEDFRLSMESGARLHGDYTHFPTDLLKDMDGQARAISLPTEEKIIDAGVYQTNIRVVSAQAEDVNVLFDTRYEDIPLSNRIVAVLEKGYTLQCDVAWDKGDYDQLNPKKYVLDGELSNLSEGVINSNSVLGTVGVIVAKNHRSDLEELSINSESWLEKLAEYYILNCEKGKSDDEATVYLHLPHFATIAFSSEVKFVQEENDVTVTLNIPTPGDHQFSIIVISQDEKNVSSYTVKLRKYFPFWSIVEQKWNNTFVINNNPKNNGGYKFISYKWYKDGVEIGDGQYYSAGNNKTDWLDESALYHAQMTSVDGASYTTCTANAVLINSGIRIYPNPVKANETITIETPIEDGQKVVVNIYSLSGLPILQTSVSTSKATISAPSNTGMYILQVAIDGGVKESVRMIVY